MAGKADTRIAVIGLGFVGLTTALGFADKGFTVFGYDSSDKIRKNLRSGRVHFHEPHLAEQLRTHAGKKLAIGDSLADAVKVADVIFFCVGTPARSSGEANIEFLQRAVSDTLTTMGRGAFRTLVIKSTVPPGTARSKILPLFKKANLRIGKDVGLANNPEFLREGIAWEDFTKPDRVVIGAGDEKSFRQVAALYAGFDTQVCRVTLGTGEFVKSSSNALLATLISFANEASMIADKVGDIDTRQAFEVLHLDRRWSGSPAKMTSYVFPGCGFGGYCLPKDTAALLHTAKSAGVKADLLRGTLAVNAAIKEHFASKIVAATAASTRIGILGLSFKAGSDDVRETPAAEIIELLLRRGRRQILAFDPMAMEAYRQMYRQPIEFAKNLKDATRRADVIVVLTAWPEFKASKKLFGKKPVFDGRYCL